MFSRLHTGNNVTVVIYDNEYPGKVKRVGGNILIVHYLKGRKGVFNKETGENVLNVSKKNYGHLKLEI